MIIDPASIIGKAVEEVRPSETLDDYDLGGIDCPICNNKGVIIKSGPGPLELHAYECECMKKRRSMRSIRKSGIAALLSQKTFDAYETPDDKRKRILAKAKRFVEKDEGWFFIAGRSGSGKTHICTAICAGLIEKGQEVRYMLWRDENVALKSCITEYEEYQRRIQKLKDVPVLYIDDFWKTQNESLSNADINQTFEILNSRYIDPSKRTVISTELMLSDIIRVDEAIGSRIFERSKGFMVKAPDENWRLRLE